MLRTLNSAMAFKPSVVVFDACVLYPFHLRNILVQVAVDELVDGRWTNEIHEEWIRNLAADRPSIPIQRLQATRQLMNHALPKATVTGHEHYVATVRLPDRDDRHVVAAAIAACASVILTWNLRDFPERELGKFNLLKETPDSFLVGLHEKFPGPVIGSLANARRNLRKSRVSATDFIDILANQKLTRFAKIMRNHLTDL